MKRVALITLVKNHPYFNDSLYLSAVSESISSKTQNLSFGLGPKWMQLTPLKYFWSVKTKFFTISFLQTKVLKALPSSSKSIGLALAGLGGTYIPIT